MESNLILEFVNKTGADSTTAHSYLKAKGWDLRAAIDGYLSEIRISADHWEENGNIRPSLHKSSAVDLSDLKKLTRGISRATDNVKLVSRARSDIALDFGENAVCNVNQYFIETPVFTFTLPDLTVYSDDFREFLEKDLIETSSLNSLETAGRLNWWVELGVCQRLWPLATSGDGNCLLHAASLGMWGFHDRLLTLRRALHGFLATAECREALWRRWRWQQTRLNAEAGLVYSEEEWNREWEGVVNMASTQPRKLHSGGWRRNSLMHDRNGDDVPENATYESLEEIHVLALAHVLRRPIIVIADVMLKDINGDDLAPIGFGGIYLPLECSPADCHRSPLVLTYDAAHFSALVVMEREAPTDASIPHPPAAIPLTSADRQLLPIQFSVDPGEQFIWGRDELIPHITQKLSLAPRDQIGLLSEYLDVMKVTAPNSSQSDQEQDVAEINEAGITDEDEIEKRFCEVIPTDVENEGEGIIFGGKAARQLQSVAKQFGSIGKSMGRKLRKNLGSITKMSRSNSQKKSSNRLNNHVVQDHIICAMLNTEQRHEYQAEMVRNYLQCARTRFELRQNGIDTGARYGAGRSRFYTGSDTRMLAPSIAPRLEPDRTLYLARSTFYDDVCGSSSHDNVRSYNMSTHSRSWGEHGEWSGIESGRGTGDSSRHSVVTTLTPPQASFPDLPYVEHVAQPCRNNACHFYGSPDRDHYCSRCYREQSNTSVGSIRCLQVQENHR